MHAYGRTLRRWGDLRLLAAPAGEAGGCYRVVLGEADLLGVFTSVAEASACFDVARALREGGSDPSPERETGVSPAGPEAGPSEAVRRAALRRDLRAALRSSGVPDALALAGTPRRREATGAAVEALLREAREVDAPGLTAAELVARLGGPPCGLRVLREVLRELRATGRVIAVGRDRYAAPHAPAAPLPGCDPCPTSDSAE